MKVKEQKEIGLKKKNRYSVEKEISKKQHFLKRIREENELDTELKQKVERLE